MRYQTGLRRRLDWQSDEFQGFQRHFNALQCFSGCFKAVQENSEEYEGDLSWTPQGFQEDFRGLPRRFKALQCVKMILRVFRGISRRFRRFWRSLRFTGSRVNLTGVSSRIQRRFNTFQSFQGVPGCCRGFRSGFIEFPKLPGYLHRYFSGF